VTRGWFDEGTTKVVPFTNYYPYFQSLPIAAYLIPRDMSDGTLIVAPDPIEDIAGDSWNQGSVYRATDVPGFIRNRRVVLEPDKVVRSQMIG
jgi:hypothetical protein